MKAKKTTSKEILSELQSKIKDDLSKYEELRGFL